MVSKAKKSSTAASKVRWDVFISHASEDKTDFVEPLASALAEFGLEVWYDRFTLSLGDSLSRSIDEGLARSRFGLVVLSPNFLSKRWPEYELRGLTAREMSEGKVILPIWHNISKEDLLRFSPPLADKLAVDSKEMTPLQIAVGIIKVIRPELFQRIAQRRAFIEMFQNAKTEFIDPKLLKPGPLQHPKLTPDLVGRIRLIRASFLEVYPHSLGFWLDGFKRDSHPSREVAVWEHLAAVYVECCFANQDLSSDQRKQLFRLILAIDMRQGAEFLKTISISFPANVVEDAFRVYGSQSPLNDFPDKFSENKAGDAQGSGSQHLDREHFPIDVPDHLITEVIALDKKKRVKGTSDT